MTAKRDSLYSSIGRAQSATVAREALAVHPLLGDSASNAKYVPYTPRQRPGPTTVAPTTPPTAKPQLATLRTAAQNIGLEANSIGWAILEKISSEGDSSDEWAEIWNALTKAKATLLLPAESNPTSIDAITPEFVQDHVVLCDLTSRDDTAVVTLSGLRGRLVHDTLTFRSTLHRSTRHFQTLLTPSVSRAVSLDALPPLPAYPPESSYPSFAISAFTPALPLSPRTTKPPLPPRPGLRSVSSSSSARLSMPFASLFGQRPSTPPPPPLPPTATTSTTASLSSTDADPTIDVTAFVIDTALSRADIATSIINTLKGEIAIALADQPPWLVERVHAFASTSFPFVRLPAGKKKLQDIGGNPNRVVYAVHPALEKPEELADRFQAFYVAVEGELRRGGRGTGRGDEGAQVEGSDSSGLRESNVEPEVGEKEMEADETRIRDVLETIELTLCTLLYDRLFLPSTSDDTSHNEALSSRIAALNMLDLGLEHLDINIGDANPAEVDALVRTCGQTLAQLDLTARSPREKATVLVSAHKLIVEGLSKIPPIHLKSQDDENNNSSRRHSRSSIESAEHASTTSSSLDPTVRVSPPQELTERQNPSIDTSVSTMTPSPISGDVLLPILIFSVVKANPSRLVSHLLFIQRFRNQSFGGEESYCLINLMAVSEFLENVDLGALGLSEHEKVLSTADLTPIPIAIVTRPNTDRSVIGTAPGTSAAVATTAATLSGDEHLASLRGRVGQGVDAIAGSANKVISGVVDSSFGVLRALLPQQTTATTTNTLGPGNPPAGVIADHRSASPAGTGAVSGETEGGTALWGVRPSFGLLRRDAGGFSLAGLTAALPGGGPAGRTRSHSHPVEVGQRELVEVTSRPASLRSHRSGYEYEEEEEREDDHVEQHVSDEEGRGHGESENEGGATREGNEAVETESEEGEEGEEEESEEDGDEEEGEDEEVHDTRSIKSFESMMSGGRTKHRAAGTSTTSFSNVASEAAASTSTKRRKRLTDLTGRLTHGMAEMSRRVQGGEAHRSITTLSGRIPPPNRRFVECAEQDIRVSEVGELLREYQRLVEAVRNAGGFQE